MVWVGIAGVCATLVGVLVAFVLGVPAWRLQRDRLAEKHAQERREKVSREQAELAVAVARYLGVPIPPGHELDSSIPPPSEDHPSLGDILKSIRDASQDAARDSAQTAVALAHHMSDGHGPEPMWVRRWADLRAQIGAD